MTMSQLVSESHQHQPGPMSNGCGRATPNGELDMEPMDLSTSAPISNGVPTTPTKLSPMEDDDFPPGQLSPGSARRRSTRASALKAQEKIKLKDDIAHQPDVEMSEIPTDDQFEELAEGSAPKKPRLMDGAQLDQYSHSFYIKEEDGGEVHEVCDESEISSLNSDEATFLRESYEKIKSSELSEEQKRERHDMIKKCEANLRLEEARLNLMKKITSSQLIAAQKALEAKKMTPNIALNTAGGAYKPTLAIPKGSGNKSNSSTAKNNTNLFASLTAEQQKEFYTRASAINKPLAERLMQLFQSGTAQSQQELAALTQALVAQQNQQKQHQQQQQQQQQAAKEALLKESSMSTSANTPQQSAAKAFAAMTPQQRAANARQAFRVQADKQLSQIAYPKTPNPDLSFIPNPNQPDFCYLVGLDLVVQRVLRDKTANADVTEGPYECEECHTDFTPAWKAIGNADDLHLYCEQCVHDTQKRKIQKDHSTFLRKAFTKVSHQEKEFEKQIAEGKLDAVMAQAAAAQAQAQGASTSQTQPQNLSTKQNGTSTPTITKSSTPVPSSTPKLPTSATNTPSSSSKKTSSANNSNSSMNAQMQQQLAMAMAMRNNPTMMQMMSAMAAGGMTGMGSGSNNANAMAQMMQQMQQMYSVQMMMQTQMQQSAQQSRTQQAQQSSNAAMALLAQAARQAQGTGRNNSNSNQFNMAALSSMNPAMIQRLQEQLTAQYKSNGKK